MKSQSLAAIAALASGIQLVSATGWLDAPAFQCPGNTNNTCNTDQSTGFNWGGLPTGSFSNYGGFNFDGWNCADSFSGSKGLVNSDSTLLNARSGGFQDKCITGVSSSDASGCPSFGHESDAFSVDTFQVTSEFDCTLDFHYTMHDGSTCKHSSFCSKGGSTIKNTQCGGAKNVTIVYPGGGPKPSCSIGVHSIGFDCSTHTSYTYSTTQAPTTTPATTPYQTSAYTTVSIPTTTSVVSAPTTTSAVSVPTTSTYAVSVPTTTSAVSAPTTSSSAAPTTSVVYSTSEASSSAASSSVSAPASYSTVSAPASYSTVSAPASSSSVSAPASYSSVSAPASSSASAPASYSSVSAPASSSSASAPASSSSASAPASSSPAVTYTTASPTTSVAGVTATTTSSAVVPPYGASNTTAVVGTTSSSAPSEVITTVIIDTTTTVCPFTKTHTESGTTSIETGTTTSVILLTTYSTITVSKTATPTVVPSSAEGVTTSSTPSSSATPLPYPSILPQCLNTWVPMGTECSSNTAADCYCSSESLVCSVYECLYAHGATPADISSAQSYLQGICVNQIASNPAIITCASAVSGAPTAYPTGPVTTVTVATTTVVPCSESGTVIPSSYTTTVLTTSVVVPQVVLTTVPGPASTVALVTGTVGPAPTTAPAAQTAAGYTTVAPPSQVAGYTTVVVPAASGAAQPSSQSSQPTTPFVNSGSQTRLGFSGIMASAMIVAMFVL